jgi:hypothetical protein
MYIEIKHGYDRITAACCSLYMNLCVKFVFSNYRVAIIRYNEKVRLLLLDVFKVHLACLSMVDEVFLSIY